MSDNRIGEIKKEDKKSFKKFIIIMVVCAGMGAVAGYMSFSFKEAFSDSISNSFMNILEYITPYVNIIMSTLVMIVGYTVYTKSKKEYKTWNEDNEDDDTIDKIEERLSYVILMTAVNMIVGYFFLGVGMKLLIIDKLNGEMDSTKLDCVLIGIIINIIATIVIQNKSVNLIKEMNPLLKGSVYDTNFNKKWIDSCDESIKLSIYKSAYKSFTSTTITCLTLWLFSIVGIVVWDFGIMPLLMITIIWLVSTVSYSLESIKLSKVK